MASEDPIGRDDISDLGINSWFVEEQRQAFQSNPASVNDAWRDFFRDEHIPAATQAPTPPPVVAVPAAPAVIVTPPPVAPAPVVTQAAEPTVVTTTAAPAAPPTPPVASPLRGAAGRLVENMVASLGVPTATSVHPLPAKLIELNRSVINEYLARHARGKISFTHLIAWAIVRGIETVPQMNASFVDDVDGKGTPGVLRHEHVGLGIAIDLQRPGGGRALVVPAIHGSDTLDFAGFIAAYEDLVARARSGKLAVEDFAGVTLTITNPGTLGTTQSVPRLMSGQGAIIGVGALDYPPEYGATDPETLTALGIGKVLTLTSTYDHRIIQGAESGLFLKYVHELLIGQHEFYDEIFASLGLDTEPARWKRDHNALLESDRHDVEIQKQMQVQTLIRTYRVRGHLMAQLDPLSLVVPPARDDLDPQNYGLSVWDYDRVFYTGGLGGTDRLPLRQILQILRDSYCHHIGVEYMHIQDHEERRWIQDHVEDSATSIDQPEQRHILDRLIAAEVFERFLHTRYVGQKRFGLEGAESTIPVLDAVLDEAARAGVADAYLGMAHRGRLNVLANIVGKSYSELFAEFEGNLDPETVQGSGDVKYHKGAVGKWTGRDGLSIAITMASNPSHLEAVDPVVEGMARAKQDHMKGGFGLFPLLPILVHGDASFAGQGVVAETLNLSLLPGYRIGGTIHLVINNQVGFTTSPADARSSVYATDVARMVQAPIFHVNGDDPEACVRVARFAVAYRQAFHKDVVIDLVCYRLHGHNEGDDPSYTQPLMYAKIEAHDPVRAIYTVELVRRGDLTQDEADQALADFSSRLQTALGETRSLPSLHTGDHRMRVRPAVPRLSTPTGVSNEALLALGDHLHGIPDGFTMHPKLARQFEQRKAMFDGGEVDWALGEALAFGSILLDGTDIRLSGQDTRRGTFSSRHSVLVDNQSGREYTPLLDLGGLSQFETNGTAGKFYVHDSLLSEYAALGFEYGYSIEAENALVLWEAQFGDFANGAQIIIDNFVAAAEEKWGQSSGLVLLLPHGYEGQGPEHSSARIERFLSLSAEDNLSVVQPTSAAQYFHVLRAQTERRVRRPLIVITPKSLLRARTSRSSIDELTSGSFKEVIDDPANEHGAGSDATRIVCASGKIGFEAIARRDELVTAGRDPKVAILQIEQLSPWPADQLDEVLNSYPNMTECVWLQDEPENMGAWNYVRDRLHLLLRDRCELRRVSRPAAGSPATGSHLVHEWEREHLLTESVGESVASE